LLVLALLVAVMSPLSLLMLVLLLVVRTLPSRAHRQSPPS
jgi:hypothetical protein